MNSLDEKLKKLLGEIATIGEFNASHRYGINIDLDEVVAQIKQLFADEHYVQVPTRIKNLRFNEEIDDIYLNTVYAKPAPGMMFAINLDNDAVYQSLKSQLYDLIKETLTKKSMREYVEGLEEVTSIVTWSDILKALDELFNKEGEQ